MERTKSLSLFLFRKRREKERSSRKRRKNRRNFLDRQLVTVGDGIVEGEEIKID